MELFGNLGINGKLLAAQAVNFLLVLWLLKKFVFSKVLSFLDERARRIQEGLELTEKAEREVERINQERHRRLQKAEEEAASLVARAREETERQRAALVAQAKDRGEEIVGEAKDAAERERREAVRKAQGDVSSLALAAASKVLARTLSEEDERQAADEVIKVFNEEYVS